MMRSVLLFLAVLVAMNVARSMFPPPLAATVALVNRIVLALAIVAVGFVCVAIFLFPAALWF
jgi:hypothetical protein